MTRIEEIRQRLDKATPGPWFAGRFSIGAGEDRGDPDAIPVERVALREDADLIANAPADLAYLLDTLARRDQRCEDLAASLDETRRDLLHAERWEQEVTDVLHTVHTMCLHGDPHHQIAEYIEQHDHRYQATTKEN